MGGVGFFELRYQSTYGFKVEPVLRAMGIKFDAPTALAVMTGRPGAAATLCYKVKMVLDRLKAYTTKAGGAPISVYEPAEGGVLPLPNMPVRLSKPSFDAASQQGFEHAIRQLVENPTEALLQAHLQPFHAAGQRFRDDLANGRRSDAAASVAADAASRAARLYEQEQNRSFMEAYEQRGLEIWMSNQERAKARLQVKRNAEVQQAASRRGRSERARAEATSQVSGGIAAFEAKLAVIAHAAQGEPRDAPGGAAAEDVAPGDDAGARAEAVQRHVAALRASKQEKEGAAAVRERRRRRFIAEREEAQAIPPLHPPPPPPLRCSLLTPRKTTGLTRPLVCVFIFYRSPSTTCARLCTCKTNSRAVAPRKWPWTARSRSWRSTGR